MANITDNSININVDNVLAEYGLDNTFEVSPEAERALEEILDESGNVLSEESSTLEPPSLTSSLESSEDEMPETQDVQEEQPSAENTNSMLSTEEALKLLIPKNSESIRIDESSSRFSGAEWYKAVQKSTILLAGLGGIGSYVLFCLSRMKPEQIFVYDDDVVETVNLSGQLYSNSMVGKTKVEAMDFLAKDFSKYFNVVAIPQKFTSSTKASDIMICGFDNMGARRTFFNSWVNHLVNHPNPEKCLFIDGRLAMEEFQVFCIKGDDVFNIKRYTEECLFNDWDAVREDCSAKQTTYCSNMIGSIITNLFTNFIANTLNPIIPRDLPFKTYYNASMIHIKTEL